MIWRQRPTSRSAAWISTLGLALALAGSPIAGSAQASDPRVKLGRSPGKAETRIRKVPTAVEAVPKRTLRKAPRNTTPVVKDIKRVPERRDETQQVALAPAAGKLHARLHGPDLQPAPGGASYCDWVLQGNKAVRSLRLKIENHGTQIAHPTDVRISINGAAQTSFPVGGYVYAGSFKALNLALPETCFGNGGSCSFVLEVDGAQQITETNETNNTASGSCPAQ